MDNLILRIDQHCQMSEDMAARWKSTGGYGKTEPGKAGKAVHNTQKGKGKDRWGEQGGGGYQREYIRGPKPHEFKASPTIFKDSLHELLKKIEHKQYFSYPADNIPCPKSKDNKYRCSYHAKRGHLTTWCPQFKEYLQELVRKGHLAEYIDQEKTMEKAGDGRRQEQGARLEQGRVALPPPPISLTSSMGWLMLKQRHG
ncbi:hypothetical protein RHGRI_030913 [Rhododendron griersonianum]|uniref:Uncharacterized protein n=1 Tax=Rhododendron griersonianum TaxID=479676 RepID=A0AAV6I673_9ERIC|nr:hypothetical protein RHGRI_030913 [Rhododendron griersonianum]